MIKLRHRWHRLTLLGFYVRIFGWRCGLYWTLIRVLERPFFGSLDPGKTVR